MEKKFCPVIGRTVYLRVDHADSKSAQNFGKRNLNRCACMSENGVCTQYFSGCCCI